MLESIRKGGATRLVSPLQRANMKKEKTGRINIYLTQKECKLFNEIKYKYHLSISTIANIIGNCLGAYTFKQMTETYLYDEKGYKTSIKPRLLCFTIRTDVNVSMFYTNCLKVFINKDINKYVTDKKLREKINNMIYEKLQNTYEDNWDGNRFTRGITKFIKNNPDYTKKILGIEQ